MTLNYKYTLAIVVGLILAIFLGFKVSSSKFPEATATTTPPVVEVTKPKNISILFVGDIMLDRTVRTTIEKNGFMYPFEDIKSIFKGNDLAIGNLEGTITSNSSLSQSNFNILKFTFPSSDVKGLKDLGFTGLSLANNHSQDFGNDGYLETMANVGVGGLLSFGSPINDNNLSVVEPVGDENICFVGYHALYNPTTTPVEKEIKDLKLKCTFVVVFAHWGVEYNDTETRTQETQAHILIDAGADLIIGAHPHVVEPIEIYKGKAIFYSLGNFIFDQNFSTPTKLGLAVRMELDKENLTFHLIGLEINRNKLSFPEKDAYQARTDILISELPIDLKEKANIDGEIVIPR